MDISKYCPLDKWTMCLLKHVRRYKFEGLEDIFLVWMVVAQFECI